MPRIENLVEVSVTDKGIERDKRALLVKIETKQNLLQLSDLLSKEGAIKGLENVVKRANKSAVAEYVNTGKSLVKNMGRKKLRKSSDKQKVGKQDKRTGVRCRRLHRETVFPFPSESAIAQSSKEEGKATENICFHSIVRLALGGSQQTG